MVKTSIIKFTIYFLLAFVLQNKLAYALPDDEKAPFELHSETADINQSTRTGVYTGNIEFDQGTSHIRAWKSIIKTDENNKLIKAIISGNKEKQAHFWTMIDKTKPMLHAYADKIYYYPNTRIIKLKGNAKVLQDNNSLTADIILYNVASNHVTTENNHKNRTTIIFHPKERTI